jgi:hypothetical protein
MRIRPLKTDGPFPTGKSREKNSSGALSNRSEQTPTIPKAAFLNPARKKWPGVPWIMETAAGMADPTVEPKHPYSTKKL